MHGVSREAPLAVYSGNVLVGIGVYVMYVSKCSGLVSLHTCADVCSIESWVLLLFLRRLVDVAQSNLPLTICRINGPPDSRLQHQP